MIVEQAGKLTGAEVLGATTVSWLASVVFLAYFADWIGLPIAPLPLLAASLCAAAAFFFWFSPDARWQKGELAAFTGISGLVLVWLLWLAWPALLPPGGGSDLAHHLQLIDYIDRHWRLVHDPTVEQSLGEMIHYTPGVHLLSSLVGRWIGRDGFHAVYLVTAVSVAIKAGFVFLIAKRTAGVNGTAGLKARTTTDGAATLVGILAVLLLFLPRTFFIGSFARYSYLAQVVSEMFAVAMWWALIAWNDHPSARPIVFFALAGVGTFLTWPIWIGPPLVVLALLAFFRTGETLRTVALGGLPIALVAALHTARHLGLVGIVRADTDMPLPRWSDFSTPFIVLSLAGIAIVALARRGRVTAWLLLACVVQGVALYGVAAANGAVVPYMAIKMLYFAIYPLAVAGALAAAAAWGLVRSRAGSTFRRFEGVLSWTTIVVVAIVIGYSTIRMPMRKPAVSESLYLAGEWARVHVDPACVDYIVPRDDTAYWLHLSVLGNRRISERTADDSTFIPRDAIIRWINHGGLPYAVADLGTIPRDVLEGTDELARFGSAVVIRRRGASSCAGNSR